MFVDQGIDWRMLSVGDGSRHPKFGGNNSPQTVTGQHRRGDCPCGGLGDLEAASDTEDMVEVIVSNALMRYPTCYVLVYDGDSAVNWAAFNQLVTSNCLTTPLQRFRSLRRRPTLTPCTASLPWIQRSGWSS